MVKKFFNGEIELLTVDEVARILGIHLETIRRYIRTGKLNARKLGRRYYISKESFKEFINGGK